MKELDTLKMINSPAFDALQQLQKSSAFNAALKLETAGAFAAARELQSTLSAMKTSMVGTNTALEEYSKIVDPISESIKTLNISYAPIFEKTKTFDTLAILISFSVAIITILVSGDNKNIQELKETESKKELYNPVDGKQLSLFQLLLSNIAYNIIVEIFYLVCLIAISLLQAIIPVVCLKFVTALCVFVMIHILLVLLESVSQMYLTFWAKKE